MLTQDKGRSANKAQKQQNNTPKPKQQKKATKTASLFVIAKALQEQKKRRENTKRQKKFSQRKTIFEHTAKARKGARTAKRHNEAILDTTKHVAKLSKKFGFNFKKKMNQSI